MLLYTCANHVSVDIVLPGNSDLLSVFMSCMRPLGIVNCNFSNIVLHINALTSSDLFYITSPYSSNMFPFNYIAFY